MRTGIVVFFAAVCIFAWGQSASAQSLNGKIIVDPTCEMAPHLCRPHVGPGPAGGPGSQPAGATSNDALRRMLKIWR